MAILVWDNKYSVGIALFDQQHQKLVDMVNKLHDAMKAGQGKAVLGDILKGLLTYTQTHFQAEEKAMSQHAYPDFNAHKKQHQDLVAQAVAIQKKFESGQAALTVEVLQFLNDWLVKHIMGSDKAYGPFLNGKGVC